MKFSSALVASLLSGSALGLFRRMAEPEALAIPQELDMALEKRHNQCVVTVTVTMTGSPPETTTSTATQVNTVTVPAAAANPPVVAQNNVQPNAVTPPAPAAPAATTTATPPPPAASSAAPKAPTQGSCNMVTNGNKWAMTYTQYQSSGGCKSAGEVSSDIAQIKAKGYTTIRMYGTDCSGLQNIGAAIRANGMKMIVGVFISGSGVGGAQSQVSDIANWGQAGNWDIVSMIVIGNEAIAAGSTDAGSLAGFISSAKGQMQAAGSGCIPITTTEPVDIIVNNAGTLCPVIDVVAANIQTYFNGGVVASDAGTFAAGQLGQIAGLCGGNKPHYNLESGWPSGGGQNGASIASPDAQAAAINSIINTIGGLSVIFSFQNDAWKAPGIEQNFGCYNVIQ